VVKEQQESLWQTCRELDHGRLFILYLKAFFDLGCDFVHVLAHLKTAVDEGVWDRGLTLPCLQVFGPNAVNSFSLLESLRQQGEVVKIGSEIEVAENKWKRCVAASILRCCLALCLRM
jgi:hypothetical protein